MILEGRTVRLRVELFAFPDNKGGIYFWKYFWCEERQQWRAFGPQCPCVPCHMIRHLWPANTAKESA